LTVASKLRCHLEHIVMPRGVRLNAAQITKLCDEADEAQRRAAIDRARVHVPFLLPEEETEAEMWARDPGSIHA
jgi:hypothetical protein